MVDVKQMSLVDQMRVAYGHRYKGVSNSDILRNHLNDFDTEVKLEALKNNDFAIGYIKNPTEEMKKIACIHSNLALKYIENPSEELIKLAIQWNEKRDFNSFNYVWQLFYLQQIDFVKRKGISKEKVNTNFIWDEALEDFAINLKNLSYKQKKWLISNIPLDFGSDFGEGDDDVRVFVENVADTDELRTELLKRSGSVIYYMDNPTEEMLLLASKHSGARTLDRICESTDNVSREMIINCCKANSYNMKWYYGEKFPEVFYDVLRDADVPTLFSEWSSFFNCSNYTDDWYRNSNSVEVFIKSFCNCKDEDLLIKLVKYVLSDELLEKLENLEQLPERVRVEITKWAHIKDASDKEKLKAYKEDVVCSFLFRNLKCKNPSIHEQCMLLVLDNIELISKVYFGNSTGALYTPPIRRLWMIDKLTTEVLQVKAIEIDPFCFKLLKNPSEKAKLKAIELDSSNIRYVENPTEEFIVNVVGINPEVVGYLPQDFIGKGFLFKLVEANPSIIKSLSDPSEDLIMYANEVMLSSSNCNKRFKEVFLNTGKTLKECISQLKLEGFSSNNIVKAVVTVLADVTWEE